MGTYTVHQAKTQLSRLLREAEEGEEVVITNRARPVARIVPIRSEKRRLGTLEGQVWVADDFDAPLEDFGEYME